MGSVEFQSNEKRWVSPVRYYITVAELANATHKTFPTTKDSEP